MRAFKDSSGAEWTVWEVYPSTPRGIAADAIHIAPRLVNGWLCFQSGDRRRRVAPIPERWEALTEMELGLLCILATELPPSRRAAQQQG